jgi:SnoaL-like domain
MMNSREIVKTLITALQSGDFSEATHHVASDFQLVGWMPQALNQEQFLALQAELDAAMPDFSYNLSDLHGHGDVVEGLIQVTGTHTRTFALPQLGIPPMRETGQEVVLPQVPVQFLLTDGTITHMRVQPVPGGGMEGLLQQMQDVSIAPRIKELDQLADDPVLQEIEARTQEPAFDQSSTSFPVSEYPE